MNDEELSERVEAASAYLDGELDVAERASVASDPDTMALVDSFTRVRESLNDVESVADEIRSSAISAALAQFDATQQAAATPVRQPALITSLRTRRLRAYRVLARVAAALIIVAVGVAALKAASNGGDNAKSSSATQPPTALVPQPDSSASKNAADAAGTAAPGVLATEGAAMVPAINNAQDLARYAASFARSAAPPAAATAPGATTAPAAASTPYAATGGGPAVAAPGPAAAAPEAGCLGPSDVVLGPISVLGSPAFAVRDTATGVVRAIAASDCRVLLTTP